MTGMQFIVPPLDDESKQNASSDGETSQSESNNANNRTVLPDELRENFEAMQYVWRQSLRASGEEAKELSRKEREKAVETAIAVDAEINRWQNGIAELEALLSAQEGRQDYSDDDGDDEEDAESNHGGHLPQPQRNAIVFPLLPPVIPPEDADENCDSDDSNPTSEEVNSSTVADQTATR
jgi:hypothetical protein